MHCVSICLRNSVCFFIKLFLIFDNQSVHKCAEAFIMRCRRLFCFLGYNSIGVL